MSEAVQASMAQGLRGSGLNAPEGVAAGRFAVHRNNVSAGLVRALRRKFPAAERLVGEAFFAAAAQAFIGEQPPRSPVLSAYGDGFAAFMAGFEPAAGVPYLPDVMRLEAARSRAYHAADAPPLEASALAAVPPERLPDLRLRLHPAAFVIRSPYPVATLWAMNGDEGGGAAVAWAAEDALVTRPALAVLVHALPPGAATFIERLGSGARFGEAVAAASDEAPGFDLAATLALALRSGSFTALDG